MKGQSAETRRIIDGLYQNGHVKRPRAGSGRRCVQERWVEELYGMSSSGALLYALMVIIAVMLLIFWLAGSRKEQGVTDMAYVCAMAPVAEVHWSEL